VFQVFENKLSPLKNKNQGVVIVSHLSLRLCKNIFMDVLGQKLYYVFKFADNANQIDELRSVMTDYVKMERDLQQFMVAVDNVKSIVSL
jgi:hypothetical protein